MILLVNVFITKYIKKLRAIYRKLRRNYVDGCLPCDCGSVRLIPHVYMGEPSMVRIHCIDCGTDGDKAETTKEATLLWNKGRTRNKWL